MGAVRKRTDRLYFPRGSLRSGDDAVLLAPETAGWTYCGLRVMEVPRAVSRALVTEGCEAILLPLAGSFEVVADGKRYVLAGRSHVFERVSDFVYLPMDTTAEISSELGGRLAVASAVAGKKFPARYVHAADVRIEVRGAGSASRQVNNFFTPDAGDADRLMAVEVLTPAGNWSSYPPHKHDEDRPGEACLEEIYYFEFKSRGGPPESESSPSGGFGFQRLYTADNSIQVTETVGSGDLLCVPRGFHGPSAAAPGYDMYYLNVLAGPGKVRSMAFCDDPRHSWVRGEWVRQIGRPAIADDDHAWSRRTKGDLVSVNTRRCTVAQALVEFLVQQYSERDGVEHRLVAACYGIFGHGNVAGIGEALRHANSDLRYLQGRNEQAMVHAASGFARMTNRLSTLACTTSVGPGATNLVTGAALATINRLPVLLLPGDVFATRRAAPVLQELEHAQASDVSVNDCLRPVSKYFDRITRAEQLPASLLRAMQVMTDPAETGAVTIALPEDVQVEAFNFPLELFRKRVWHVRRPPPEASLVLEAAKMIRASRRPLIVAGGGVLYSDATEELLQFVDATGIPVCETQAGKGALLYGHPLALGGVGVTGTRVANCVAAEADLVIGVGTRWTDFTTASHTAFAAEDVRFINANVASVDAAKHAGLPLIGDARDNLSALLAALGDHHVELSERERVAELVSEWDAEVDKEFQGEDRAMPSQVEVIGALSNQSRPDDVIVCAAGSMPGELHRYWRPGSAKQYHVEYGYSCMGYEVAGGLG